jgi:hypothetical protein
MVRKSSVKRLKVNKLWIAFVLLLLVQILTLNYILKFHKDFQDQSSFLFNRRINESESSRYTTPVIDVSEDRVYIPEERIFMPLTDTSRKMLYDVSVRPSLIDIYLSTTDVVGRQMSSDDPSCDRMVRISTSKDAGEGYVGEILPMKNGLRYIYQNNSNCSIYPTGTRDALVELARSIQQY